MQIDEATRWVHDDYRKYQDEGGVFPLGHCEDVFEYFAKFSVHLRDMYDLTQEQFAEELGTTHVSVSNWENTKRRKLPSAEMLLRYRKFARKRWMKNHFSNDLRALDTDATIAVRDLVEEYKDVSAQNLGEYLLEHSGPQLPDIERAHLALTTCIAYGIPNAQDDVRGKELAHVALEIAEGLPKDKLSIKLIVSIRNEILGYRNAAVKTMEAGAARNQEAIKIIWGCYENFDVTKQMAYLNNALECICDNKLAARFVFEAIELMVENEEGAMLMDRAQKVREKALKRDEFAYARQYLEQALAAVLEPTTQH